jgi:hypothetical protein
MPHRCEHQHQFLLVMLHVGAFRVHFRHQHHVALRIDIGERRDGWAQLVAENDAKGRLHAKTLRRVGRQALLF